MNPIDCERIDPSQPGRVCKIHFAHAGIMAMVSLCQITDELHFAGDAIFLRLFPTEGARFLQVNLRESIYVVHLKKYGRKDISRR